VSRAVHNHLHSQQESGSRKKQHNANSNVLVYSRSRTGPITTQQAQLLLTALLQTSAAGAQQRAEAWPALLELLARFAAGAGQTRLASGALLLGGQPA
jgi:hypothetical protein